MPARRTFNRSAPRTWRNGRRKGLKIPRGETPVPVRVRPSAPKILMLKSFHYQREKPDHRAANCGISELVGVPAETLGRSTNARRPVIAFDSDIGVSCRDSSKTQKGKSEDNNQQKPLHVSVPPDLFSACEYHRALSSRLAVLIQLKFKHLVDNRCLFCNAAKRILPWDFAHFVFLAPET